MLKLCGSSDRGYDALTSTSDTGMTIEAVGGKDTGEWMSKNLNQMEAWISDVKYLDASQGVSWRATPVHSDFTSWTSHSCSPAPPERLLPLRPVVRQHSLPLFRPESLTSSVFPHS